jgi:hypothetical protein
LKIKIKSLYILWRQYKLATIRHTEFLRKEITGIPNIAKSEFQFSDSPDIGISKKKLTEIFGIEHGIGILLTMGVPEIGNENQNSQPRPLSRILSTDGPLCIVHGLIHMSITCRCIKMM